jgi:hypothetical protein
MQQSVLGDDTIPPLYKAQDNHGVAVLYTIVGQVSITYSACAGARPASKNLDFFDRKFL